MSSTERQDTYCLLEGKHLMKSKVVRENTNQLWVPSVIHGDNMSTHLTPNHSDFIGLPTSSRSVIYPSSPKVGI